MGLKRLSENLNIIITNRCVNSLVRFHSLIVFIITLLQITLAHTFMVKVFF